MFDQFIIVFGEFADRDLSFTQLECFFFSFSLSHQLMPLSQCTLLQMVAATMEVNTSITDDLQRRQ